MLSFAQHSQQEQCLRRYVRDPEAMTQALQQVWPLLEKGFTRHKGNMRAIERYARCPRYALRSAGAHLPRFL